jgi:hypothetical protein
MNPPLTSHYTILPTRLQEICVMQGEQIPWKGGNRINNLAKQIKKPANPNYIGDDADGNADFK